MVMKVAKITKSSEFWKNMNDYIIYWRLNIHRFIVEYMCLDLHLFQQITIYLMDNPGTKKALSSFIFFASRGLGKTFLTMAYCVAKCILFPGIQIKVASSSIKQANEFFKKIYEIQNGRPNIENEIESAFITRDYGEIKFHNGSAIEAVVCGDTSRGMRANILILDESRLMDEHLISQALVPFLTKNNRNQVWASNPKYRKYIEAEHNSKIFLTSIGYKDEWAYRDFQSYYRYMAEGMDDYCCISVPYQFAVEAGIIAKDFIASQLRERKTDLSGLRMEYEVIPHGESESAMFSFNEVNSARELLVPLIPPTNDEYIEVRGVLKNLPYYQKKESNEIRVASMDIAVGAGRKNDLTVFTIFRCFANIDYYDKEVSYIEVMSGANLDAQILRLKQLFYDLECDYAVIDAGGAIGIEAINSCGNTTKDVLRNKRYPGWKTMNKVEKYDMRITDPNAEPVIFPIQLSGVNASSLQYNMLVIAQLNFQRKRISLLVDEETAINELNKRYKYLVLKTSINPAQKEQANNMLQPFVNTSKLIDEAIKTQIVRMPSGRWVYDEKNGRKDRIISLIYGLYFINTLEEDLINLDSSVNISDYVSNCNYKKKNLEMPFYNNLKKLSRFGRRR